MLRYFVLTGLIGTTFCPAAAAETREGTPEFRLEVGLDRPLCCSPSVNRALEDYLVDAWQPGGGLGGAYWLSDQVSAGIGYGHYTSRVEDTQTEHIRFEEYASSHLGHAMVWKFAAGTTQRSGPAPFVGAGLAFARDKRTVRQDLAGSSSSYDKPVEEVLFLVGPQIEVGLRVFEVARSEVRLSHRAKFFFPEPLDRGLLLHGFRLSGHRLF